MWAKLAREWGVPGWFRMRYAYAETTPVLNLAAPSQIRGGWPEVGTTAAESARLPHITSLDFGAAMPGVPQPGDSVRRARRAAAW